MITFKNIAGNKFLAVGTIQRKSALNGEKSLTGTLYDGKDVLNKIDKGWSLEFDGEPYVVTYFERNDNDNSVSFDAIHKFFWDMTKSVLYSETSGSHTIKWYLDQIFADMGYSYALNFNPNAIQKENWGMKNKLSLFNDIISSIEGEFEINGTLISIFKNIGTDLSTIVRYGFNLSDMTLENDATSFVTYGEGFGEYADPENMTGDRLHVTYTSPLASVYGKLQAEPIDNRNYTIAENLLAAVKKQVDDSFSVSVNLSLYDLSVAGYPYKMANVGDWLTAVDENLDFKQRIRIISIDDDFAVDGTRISYAVTAGNVGVTKRYQDANASLASKVEEAVVSSGRAITDANIALIAANGKNKSYYLNNVDDLPQTANEGDLAWVQSGDGRVLYIYTKKSDGSYYWEKRIDPEMGEQIEAGVNDAITTSKENTDKAIADNNTQINETINQVAKEQVDLAIKDGDFNNKAQAMTDKALSDAKANTTTVAKETLDTATENLTAAKKSLTTDLQKEVSDRTTAVAALDTKAKGYADQAKQDAISAAATADGVINKKIDDTKDSITTTINQNKVDADGKITTAQSTATQALNEVKTKISQTEYNSKTGQLTTDVNTVTQTANQSKQDIVAIKQKDGDQDSRMNTIESDASGTKQTVSQLQTVQGQQSGSISTLQQRADGFDATVTKVNNLSTGDRNYILDTGNPKTQTSNGKDNQDFYNSASLYEPLKNWGVANADYIISFDWSLKDVLSSDMTIGVFFNQPPWQANYKTIPANQKNGHIEINFKLWAQMLVADKDVTGITFRINSQMSSGNQITYSNLFMKSGNISNNWTPAPEDGEQATAKAQLTADQAKTSLNNYKTDVDGRITKAQSDITQTAKDVTTKVSQSDYDKKTGDLSTSVSKAQQTADSAVTTIGNYKTSNDNRVSATETSIAQNTKDITLRATTADLDSAKNDYNSQISQVNVNAQGITNQVSSIQTKINSMGQVNQLANTEFNPDYSGWYTKYPNPTAKDVVSTQFTNVGTDGFGSNMVSHKGNGSWIASSGVPVAPGMKLSFSARFFAPQAITSGGTPIALYIMAYDANGNRTLSNGYNVPVPGLSVSSNTYKLQNVTIPDKSVVAYAIFAWNVTDEVYISQPMLVFGSTVGDYVPGAYNSNDKVALQQITIDGITDTVSKQGTNIDSVTKRVTTAEGTLSTATNNISGLQTSVTQTANQLKQEVTDRTTGDSNTLQSSKDFTTSSVSSAVTGMNSTVTQTANGILAQVEATNMVVNSEFDPLNGTWYALSNGGSVGSTAGVAWNAPKAAGFADWPAVNGSRIVSYAVATWYTSALVTASAGKVFSASIVAGRSPAPTVSTALDYRIGFWDSSRKLLATSSAENIIDGTAYKGIQKYVVENKTAPANTAFVSVIIAHSSANATDYICRPSLNVGAKASPYTATYGTSSSSTVLSLFKDNWSIGITDNIGKITSGIVGNSSSMSLISKNITLDGNTTVTGDFYAKGGNFKNLNASNITVGTLNGNQVNITNVNAANITGDITNFIQSNWNGAYGSTVITNEGMVIATGSMLTNFNSYGMDISMANGGFALNSGTKLSGAANGIIMGMKSGSTFTSFGFQSGNTNTYLDEMVILKTGSAAAAAYNIGGGVAFNHNVSLMDNVYIKPGKGYFMEWGKPGKAIFFNTINSGIPAIVTPAGSGIAFGSGGQLYLLSHNGWEDYNNTSIKGSFKTDYVNVTGEKA